MGLLSCFRPSQRQKASTHLSQEVQELNLALASAQKHVTQLQDDRSQLLHELASRPATPCKQDAATEIATVSVAVQVKPPVTQQSRIPRPAGEDFKEADTKEADGSNAPVKSRIPAPPVSHPPTAVADAVAPTYARSPSWGACRSPPRSPTRSARNLLIDEPPAAAAGAAAAYAVIAAGEAAEATLSAAASPRAVQLGLGASRAPSIPDLAALASPKAAIGEQQSVAAAGAAQRVEVLQQQVKVAEAFRASMEAELRDARFANTNLQTQMLSLQTKFEKTIEEQLCEVERLIKLRKEGQDAHEQAIQQVHALKLQLELHSQAAALAKREGAAAAKHAAELEQEMQHSEAALAHVRKELAAGVAELEQRSGECKELTLKLQVAQQRAQSADVRVLQLQAVAQQADEAHKAAMKQVEAELHDQKALYDSTVEEMLQLNNNYNELKQSYHKLKGETRNHDQMVQLVQQELYELSYYAAAGRVALGIAPASTLTSFRSSEISMGSIGGVPPAAVAAAGEDCSGELLPGVRVTDGRLHLPDGRVNESRLGDDVDPKVLAAVKAIRALSQGSSDSGSAAAGPEAATEPAATADAQPGHASKPGPAVLSVQGEEGSSDNSLAAAGLEAATEPAATADAQPGHAAKSGAAVLRTKGEEGEVTVAATAEAPNAAGALQQVDMEAVTAAGVPAVAAAEPHKVAEGTA